MAGMGGERIGSFDAIAAGALDTVECGAWQAKIVTNK